MPQYRLEKAIDMIGNIIKSGAISETGYASCILLIGETGIGKSTAIKEWCEENDYGYKTVWMNGLEDNGDILGRTYEVDLLDEEGNATGEKITKFAPPEFLPIVSRDGNRGVLVIEEINSIPVHLIEQMKCLVSERRLGEYHLPKGWVIIGTANPTAEDKNFSTSEYNTFSHDAAIRARMIEFPVRTDLSSWLAYTYKRGQEVNPDLGSLLMSSNKTGSDADLFTISSPRQFSTLNALMNSMPGLKTEEIAMLCDGVIRSDEFTQAMVAFLDSKGTRRPFTPSEILANPEECYRIYEIEAEANNEPFLYFTWHNLSLYVKNQKSVEVAKRTWRLADKKLFNIYQRLAKVTPQDILIAGLMISMENIGYTKMFMDEDPEFFETLKDRKKALSTIFERTAKQKK